MTLIRAARVKVSNSMRLTKKGSIWKAALGWEEGAFARRFARTYVIAFLAGAVGIACPPAKLNGKTVIAHPESPNRNAS
jgi:hypothetical protein